MMRDAAKSRLGRRGEIDLEPVAFALIAAGYFGAGVTGMALHMRRRGQRSPLL